MEKPISSWKDRRSENWNTCTGGQKYSCFGQSNPSTDWSFQVLTWVPYLWQTEVPKKVLGTTFCSYSVCASEFASAKCLLLCEAHLVASRCRLLVRIGTVSDCVPPSLITTRCLLRALRNASHRHVLFSSATTPFSLPFFSFNCILLSQLMHLAMELGFFSLCAYT